MSRPGTRGRTAAIERLEHAARRVFRRRSLQSVDTIAQMASLLWPALRYYRLARILAISGDIEGRGQLASAATKGRRSYAELMTELDAFGANSNPASARSSLRTLRRKRAEVLAGVMFRQDALPEDHERALTILEWIRGRWGPNALTRPSARIYAELLLERGERTRAREALPSSTRASDADDRLLADILNPFSAGNEGSSIEAWLDVVNAPYRRAGVEPLRLSDGPPVSAFDRVLAERPTARGGSVRVTVVVSSFRPNQRMLTAVKSIIASSWPDLEILIFDDASGPHFASWYAKAVALDPRVVVHKVAENGGTYRIRNRALSVATGTFLTFHDSDDWMHPRRIEMQALHLISHPDVPANASISLRVTEDLRLSHPRSIGPKICEPSLMIRREAVVEKVGYFDNLRKAADAEYRKRIEAGFGTTVPVVSRVPLTLQRIATDSLTDAEIRGYWMHLDRRVHRACYDLWHERSLARGTVPHMEHDSAHRERPFFAPASLGAPSGSRECDVVVAANWLDRRVFGRAERRRLALVRHLASAGLSVAVAQVNLPAPAAARRLALSRRLTAMLNARDCDYVGSGDVRSTKVVVATPLAAAQLHAQATIAVSSRLGIVEPPPPGAVRRFARALAASALTAHEASPASPRKP